MIRRITLAAVFAAVALSSTGCCGTIRNFVYRIRHCGGCYPAYAGCGSCGDCSTAVPSYAMPIADAGPYMGAPGCSSCGGAPTMPNYAAGAVPMVPGYAMPSNVVGTPNAVAGAR